MKNLVSEIWEYKGQDRIWATQWTVRLKAIEARPIVKQVSSTIFSLDCIDEPRG